MSEHSDSRPEKREAERPLSEPAADFTPESVESDETESRRQWRELLTESLPGLRAFLKHRLAQQSDVDDCLQVVSVRMIEKGKQVAPAARKAWLFRVAANESARMWRSKASTEKALQNYPTENAIDPVPSDQMIHAETIQQLQNAIDDLPPSWQAVVRLRIHENLTFQQIAQQLDIPLGTALTQMRRALERLRNQFDPD